MKVRNDSIMVGYPDSVPWLNYWGKLHSDSTIEILFIQPFMTGGHRIYNWGKLVKSYVATEDLENTEVFNIWPNPSTDYLNLSDVDKMKSISIFNTQGIKLLFFQQVTNQKIDISILPEGLYWIQIFSDGKILTKQFFKTNIK
ncbi:MAG: T9SS type A sorting domain-containing protein [Saprospiraceae bacterium]|nr:T9SS type A sorting domain-containing protein [Saprospiraceae bacterium]